jgi:hypothetical protein
LGLVLTVSLGFASAASLQGTTEGPEVSMASTKRDFGDVFAGEELIQKFLVQNLGSKQLELVQKSNLGSRPATPLHPATAAALWRPSGHRPVRFVGANRAAPS